jgi:D-proline reductase (dithiol) PrdB
MNVPVLARWIESAGIPTVVVTMMPALAEERRAPRIVGVEFPYGHAFGLPGDTGLRRRVLELGLRVLAGASAFGTRVDLDVEWPVPLREAYRAWQPKVPSPIVKKMLEARRENT